MRRILGFILLAGLLAAAALGDGPVAGRTARARKPRFGSAARQRLLKMRLRLLAGGSLAATVDQNRQEWRTLPPELRQQYRERAYAFLQKNPQRQEEILGNFEKFIRLDPQRRRAYRRRAAWIQKVLATLSDAERRALAEMPAEQRARRLLELKDELEETEPSAVEAPELPSGPAEAPADPQDGSPPADAADATAPPPDQRVPMTDRPQLDLEPLDAPPPPAPAEPARRNSAGPNADDETATGTAP